MTSPEQETGQQSAGGPGAQGAPSWSAPSSAPPTAYPAQSAWGVPPTPPGTPPTAGYPQQAGHGPQPWSGADVRPGTIPLRPLGLLDVLDGAFRSVRHNPRVMIGMTALVVAVAVVIQALLSSYVTALLAGELGGYFRDIDPDGTLGLDITLASTVADLLTSVPTTVLASLVLSGLLVVCVSRSTLGEVISPGELWTLGMARIWRLLGVTATVFLANLLAMAAWLGPSIALGLQQQWGWMLTWFFLGGTAYVVFALWFGVRTLLAPATIMLEGGSVVGAIRRAWGLTRRSFWRVLGYYLVVQLIVGVVAAVIVTPIAMVSAIFFPPESYLSFGPYALAAVGDALTLTATAGFTAAAIALIYIDLRMRREGLDVTLARAAAERAGAAR